MIYIIIKILYNVLIISENYGLKTINNNFAVQISKVYNN